MPNYDTGLPQTLPTLPPLFKDTSVRRRRVYNTGGGDTE